MPDRLSDALNNSLPAKHHLRCRMCGHVVKGNTALGVRFSMRRHRKSMHSKKK